MKRILAILLVVVMIFAFAAMAACSKEEDTKQDGEDNTPGTEDKTPGDEDTSSDGEETDDETFIAILANSLDDSFMLGVVSSVQEKCEAEGWRCEAMSCEAQIPTQIEQIENYTVMGADCMIIMPMDANVMKDPVLAAMDKGIYVIYLGLTPSDYEISGLVNVSQTMVGEAAAEMMLAWVEQTHPEVTTDAPLHAGIYRYSTNAEMLSRTDAIEESFAKDGRVEIVYNKDLQEGTVTEGYDSAEEAMTFDNSVRLFACFSSSVAMGCSNYVMSQSFNNDEFASFGTEDNEDARAAVDGSANGETVMRGIIGYGGEEGPDASLFKVAKALIEGTEQAPYYLFDPVYTYNSFGYEMAE